MQGMAARIVAADQLALLQRGQAGEIGRRELVRQVVVLGRLPIALDLAIQPIRLNGDAVWECASGNMIDPLSGALRA